MEVCGGVFVVIPDNGTSPKDLSNPRKSFMILSNQIMFAFTESKTMKKIFVNKTKIKNYKNIKIIKILLLFP